MWKRYEGGACTGILVKGDPSVPPTRWWNHLYLLWFGWKQVAVFWAPARAMTYFSYRIGYRTCTGEAFIRVKPIQDNCFRMLVGHEDVTFFAVDRSYQEVPIGLAKVTARDDPTCTRYPLY